MLFEKKKEAVDLTHELDSLQAQLGALQRENLMLSIKQLRLQDSRDIIKETTQLKESIYEDTKAIADNFEHSTTDIHRTIAELGE